MNRAEWEKLKKSTQPSNKYAFGDTSIDVLGNILQGAVKGLEGIFDISSTAVGAVGGLFDKEYQKSVQERIKFDYTSWLFNPNDMKKDTKGSLINKLGDKGQMIARGTAQGLGQMLPAIGANVLLPGSGLATLGISAAGTGTESAYNEGADYGEGAAYGILSGVVEMATEKLTGGFTKGVVGKGLLDDAIDGALKKVGKSALFKFAKNFAEEGFEEMLATAIEPTLRSIYQEGAYKETFSKEHTEQMLYDGLIGGLTSMAYGGTIGQIGKSTRNVTESIEDYNKIDAKKTSLWEKGKLDDATELKLNAEKEATQVELKKRLSKLSDERRAQIIKDYKLDIDDKGNFRSYESEDGYNKSAYSATLHGKEKTLRYKPVKGETTEAQKQAIKLHSDLNKISRVKTDIVIAEDLGTIDGNKVGASFENGVMYIDSSINDETVLKRKIIHEMTHSAETIGKGAYATYRDALLNAMKDNAEVKKLLDPKGDLWQSTVQRYKAQLEGKTEFEQAYIVTTELVAQYSEVLFSDTKVIERLTQDNRNVAQKLYNKIKNLIEYWQSRKGKTAQEKDYLAFLRNAEKMYKAALESTETRSDLKTVRSIGEKIEGKGTEKTETERNSIDSNGNKLSQAQQAFFKDSKPRDENGNLMELYHGTSKDITTFEPSTHGEFGSGIYLTNNKATAEFYGSRYSDNPKVISAYINMKKPYEIKKVDYIKKTENITPNTFKKQLQKQGYDGIIGIGINGIDKQYIVFNPNQIKLTTNENPTNDDDIRYSIDYREKYYNSNEDNNLADNEKNKINLIQKKYNKLIETINEETADYEDQVAKLYQQMENEIGNYIESLNNEQNELISKAEANIENLYDRLNEFVKSYNKKANDDETLSISIDESRSWYNDGFKSRYIVIESSDGDKAKIRISGHDSNSDADLIVSIAEIANNVQGVYEQSIDMLYEKIALFDDDIRYSIEGTKATDKDGNPILLYHGSPTKDISEFDVNKAGNNASSGERAIFFTDSKDFADEFAYERKQGSSVHTFRRGEKGQIYSAYLDMKKPLDVRNLSMEDAEIIAKNAYIPVTAEKLIEYSKIPNKMILKSYIDFTRLPSLGYDGYIGYAQQGVNQYEGVTEYAVFSNNQIIRKQDYDIRYSIGYHAGDLGKSENYFNMASGSRGTGHFGTGTYFVSAKNKLIGDYNKRPIEEIDLSKYKMYRPSSGYNAQKLHDVLKLINRYGEYLKPEGNIFPIIENESKNYRIVEPIIGGNLSQEVKAQLDYLKKLNINYNTLDEMLSYYLGTNIDKEKIKKDYYSELGETVEDTHKFIEKAKRDTGLLKFELKSLFPNADIDNALVQMALHDNKNKNADYKDQRTIDSNSTVFMKSLGYEGIDVTNMNDFDNTQYGTVVYDLKGKDLTRKQEIGTARFSILAADDKTMYNEKEIKAAMESALAEALNLGNYEYGELSKMAEKDMMDLFENELKNSKDIDATAKKIAEFIVMNATVENAMAEDDATPEDYKTYNILKYYRNKFNLDGIKEDIKHAFGNDTTAFLHWGKRKGTNGVTADVIAKELESKGIYIDAINEADIFIKFIDMYKEVSDKVNGRAKEIKKTVSQTTNGFMVDSIIDDLSNDIKGILDKSARKALPSDVAREKNKQIAELKANIKDLASKITELETQYGAETEKSNEYRMEMYHLQYKIDRLNLEMQDTKAYSDYLSKSLKIVREDVKNITNRLADEMVKHRLENRLFERIDRVKNLTNYAGSGVQYADEVIALVKVLKKAKTWRGQLSSNIREIMRTYARTVDGKALYDILAKSENVYGQAIQSIANGTGDLSNGELRALAEIFDNFVHNVNEYDRVFFEGRKQSERELADQAIKDTETIVPFKQGSIAKMWQRFDNWLESPIWRFSRLSNYDDDGVMNRIFWEITVGLKKQEEFNMRVAEYFKPFIKKNKSIAKSWREIITINGIRMSKGQAMGLYLTSLREQAKTHIYNKTETIVTENGISVKRKGIIRLVDETLAEKSLREAQEKGHNIEVTEEFINGLFSEFTTEERQFIRLAYDFFNTMSAEAKTETDMALYGVAGNLEKHYYPIRVADDQIYKQIGNQKPFGDLFTVFNPSFTKKTTQNANNVVVIENILDVVNRHSRQMAAYYGLAQPIKAFNRVWNAKTEKGTLKQAVMKVDSGFEHYVSQLFNDMQGNNEAKEGFDKVLSKMRGWGAIASLGLNPKVWVNQSVSLLAAKGVGFKYKHLMAGLAKAITGKTDFETLTKLSPIMYSRFRDGHNIDSGLLQEGKGITGKIGTLQEMTLAPISWMDKMMIGSIWNAALIQYGTPEKAALMVEKAVIISQANYTPLFRPQILRSHSSALQLMTMFMSEPLQMYSQLAGAVDKLRVAHFLKNNAKSAEEIDKADKLLAKAKEDGRHAFTAVSVDMVMLSFIAMLFDWIKGKDDEDKTFSEKFGNEMLANIMGMFPIAREIYSLSQGFDITNMAYTGLTNIYNAANEIYGSTKSLISGEYQSPQEIQGGIRKTIVGLSQAFGIPLRNLETYTKGIAEKFAPGAVETYESWFYKKSEKAYQDMMTEALAKGDDKFADTLAGLILDNKLTISNKTVIDETKRLYLKGFDSMPNTINKTMTYDGKEYELTARDFEQFAETYSKAENAVEKLLNSYQYKRLTDDVKAEAIKIIYDYYYNLAKTELVGEDVSKIIALSEDISIDKLSIILSKAKNLTADKDEQGKSISGSKKYKIEQAMIGLYLTAKQKNAIMDYLGYSI